jgi:high frequency lysogenization protein
MERQLEQTLALAAVVQNAWLVNQLALKGTAVGDKLDTAINSLFVTQPRSSEEVFGSVQKLNLGLQTLQEYLGGKSGTLASDEVLRYVLGILHLEGRLAKRKDLLEKIGTELERLQQRYPVAVRNDNQQLVQELARLYQDTISTLPFRIQVKGDMLRLQNDFLAARIRVLLFAGIRAAVLWRQRGGRRWQLLFLRQRLRRDVTRLLHQLP